MYETHKISSERKQITKEIFSKLKEKTPYYYEMTTMMECRTNNMKIKRIKQTFFFIFFFFFHFISFIYSFMLLCKACVVRKHVSTMLCTNTYTWTTKKRKIRNGIDEEKNDFVTCFVLLANKTHRSIANWVGVKQRIYLNLATTINNTI